MIKIKTFGAAASIVAFSYLVSWGAIEVIRPENTTETNVDLPCCWDVPKGVACQRCRDASAETTKIAYQTRTYCRVRWEVFYDRINNRCIRYGRDQWLCPVETCERI